MIFLPAENLKRDESEMADLEENLESDRDCCTDRFQQWRGNREDERGDRQR
jgi:hypothetical protein